MGFSTLVENSTGARGKDPVCTTVLHTTIIFEEIGFACLRNATFYSITLTNFTAVLLLYKSQKSKVMVIILLFQ